MVKSASLKIVWDFNAVKQLTEILEYLEEQSSQAPKIVKKQLLKELDS